MKILLLGKNGLLGKCFERRLGENSDIELRACDRSDLDITSSIALLNELIQFEPDIVINCAAYTAVDDCEENQDLAFSVNGDAVGELAKVCKMRGAVLIHFSTDYIFGGENANGYKENADTDPINVYGESKLAGEKLIAENMHDYYIIRTSWLFGPDGGNFVDTMIKLGGERDELSIVDDQIGSPTYSEDLVEAVVDQFLDGKLHYGIYHLTNSETCSWYDFAKKIFEFKGMNLLVKPVGSDEFKRPAKRPHHSTLLNTKTPPLRPWEEALGNYL